MSSALRGHAQAHRVNAIQPTIPTLTTCCVSLVPGFVMIPRKQQAGGLVDHQPTIDIVHQQKVLHDKHSNTILLPALPNPPSTQPPAKVQLTRLSDAGPAPRRRNHVHKCRADASADESKFTPCEVHKRTLSRRRDQFFFKGPVPACAKY
jgi:hypothetical protein